MVRGSQTQEEMILLISQLYDSNAISNKNGCSNIGNISHSMNGFEFGKGNSVGVPVINSVFQRLNEDEVISLPDLDAVSKGLWKEMKHTGHTEHMMPLSNDGGSNTNLMPQEKTDKK